ncbi:MAG: hypothetical protein JOY64_17805 [Alphaproteobacteria bacterium]|nr:hypothetical protein [Alphaproteobacteria bacterium]
METRDKIFPRNLTARAAYQVPGNPDTSRPEDAVANCYPGLELDLRNLDRRFFPGLLFNYVARPDNSEPYSQPHRYGARLFYVDYRNEPDLALPYPKELAAASPEWQEPLAARLLDDLSGDKGTALAEGNWYIDWVGQAVRDRGGPAPDKRIVMNRRDGTPLDGLFVWRIIRGLEFAPLTLGLKCRDTNEEIVIEGWRRRFTHPHTGVISLAYQPGEMLQSLCSPWQHDFRDCSCHYWASNRPDIVHGEIYPGEPVLPSGRAEDPVRATVLLDWMRADHSRAMAAAAQNNYAANRPFQMDHYQINSTWQVLNVVVNNTEIGDFWMPPQIDSAKPYNSPAELAKAIKKELAPLEMTLALEYLYARFSLRAPEECQGLPMMADDMLFARHVLILVAVAEMEHLRAGNELLWLLHQAEFVRDFEPVLTPAKRVRVSANGKSRRRMLRRLEPATLDDFIAIERPSGFIDGAYARTVATLRQPGYPKDLLQMSERIVADGMQHYQQFCDLRSVLRAYEGTDAAGKPVYPYLRDVEVASDADAADALALYGKIRDELSVAYQRMSSQNYPEAGALVLSARAAMAELLEVGDKLAARGIGIPFWRP